MRRIRGVPLRDEETEVSAALLRKSKENKKNKKKLKILKKVEKVASKQLDLNFVS